MKSSKSLLYLSVYDPHVPYTGAGVRGAQFVSQLAQNFIVDVVYLSGSGHPGDSELEKKFEHKIKETRKKIKIPFSKKDYFYFSKNLYSQAKILLDMNKYDFIIADYGLSASYANKLSKQYNVPFIYCSHNIEFRQYLGKVKSDPRRLLFVPRVYFVEKQGCKNAEIVVAISESDKEFYTNWIPEDKIIVIPQGFDESSYNPSYSFSSNVKKKVLFFGNYNISTNREAVYAARDYVVDEVVKTIPKVEFQFIGANPPQDIHHPNMQFLGFVEDILDYIKKADIVISPILHGWGMPTKVIEALACGKPVIATEPAAREVPKEFKSLYIVNIEQFSKRIIDVFEENNPVRNDDYESLKKNFSWQRIIERLIKKINNSNGK